MWLIKHLPADGGALSSSTCAAVGICIVTLSRTHTLAMPLNPCLSHHTRASPFPDRSACAAVEQAPFMVARSTADYTIQVTRKGEPPDRVTPSFFRIPPCAAELLSALSSLISHPLLLDKI